MGGLIRVLAWSYGTNRRAKFAPVASVIVPTLTPRSSAITSAIGSLDLKYPEVSDEQQKQMGEFRVKLAAKDKPVH